MNAGLLSAPTFICTYWRGGGDGSVRGEQGSNAAFWSVHSRTQRGSRGRNAPAQGGHSWLERPRAPGRAR